MDNKRIIYQTSEGGVAIVVPSVGSGLTIEQVAKKDVPQGSTYEVVDISLIPNDRLFRGAWELDLTTSPEKVKVNLGQARLIAHDFRRHKRKMLFRPLDIQATIPGKAVEAEAARQVIRDADAVKQIAIDDAADEAELRLAMTLKPELTG